MLSQQRVAELLAAIGAKTPAPASGAATALTAALAAALAELAARYAGDDTGAERAAVLAAELLVLGDEDAAAYAAFMADRSDATRAEIVRVPEEIALRADEVAALARTAAGRVNVTVAADAQAAVHLGQAAAQVARNLAGFNRAGS
jgi:methenyltetrahydrofolate cyclohydrolase